jgi:hypothetical protein
MDLSATLMKPLSNQVFKQKRHGLLKIFSWPKASQVSYFGSQSGQAVLEYVLILVVVVGISLGVLYQLNTALKKYVQSYFGDYVACLLETGELPGLGGDAGISADSCNALYEPFSLKNGRPLKESSGGDSSSSAQRQRDSSSRDRDSNRSGSNSRMTKNNATLNADRSRGDQVVSGSVSKNKRTELKGRGGAEDGASSYSTKKLRDGSQMKISTRFKTNDGKDKNSGSKKIDMKGKLAGRSSKKISVDMDKFKRQTAAISDTNLELSFGDYLRYILIFAIIVVIIIFFGGQLFQLRKSWEKN